MRIHLFLFHFNLLFYLLCRLPQFYVIYAQMQPMLFIYDYFILHCYKPMSWFILFFVSVFYPLRRYVCLVTLDASIKECKVEEVFIYTLTVSPDLSLSCGDPGQTHYSFEWSTWLKLTLVIHLSSMNVIINWSCGVI